MTGSLTQKQVNALGPQGTTAEQIVVRWLKKKGYHIDYSHRGKKSNLPYDILATKGKEKWVIDVKSGNKPQVKIQNIEKMIEKTPGYNTVGLALVGEDGIYLLQYNKWTKFGEKAAKTRKLSQAGKKSWVTRLRHEN